MKKVLMIAYLFPPHGGGGVQRTTKFAKYLPHFGWQPTVLSARQVRLADRSLLTDLPSDLQVERTRALVFPRWVPHRIQKGIARWILITDKELGWYPFAVRRGKRLLQNQQLDALFSTSVPHTSHMVGLRLKEIYQVPWIADFRDAWIDHIQFEYPSFLQRRLAEHLERAVVHQADRIVVVNERLREHFVTRYPEMAAEHFVTIPNGFDPDDYQDIQLPEKDARFTLIYTGSLYGTVQTARPFLQALRQLLEGGSLSPSDLRVLFVGSPSVEAPQLVAEWGLEPVVEFLGYVPHQQVIGYQLMADVLLLILGRHPNSDIVLPGKTLEYLRSGQPILALVPSGVTADVLREAGVGRFAPPDDPAVIAGSIIEMYEAWRRNELNDKPDPEIIARYDRRRQTQRLVALLEDAGR